MILVPTVIKIAISSTCNMLPLNATIVCNFADYKTMVESHMNILLEREKDRNCCSNVWELKKKKDLEFINRGHYPSSLIRRCLIVVIVVVAFLFGRPSYSDISYQTKSN
ncbi:hypothetical protein L6452_09797 [Arctium lappa]|uniref:Uncharacterized protein n=1 Tax=Arctium lappa TaxID=4217 RepID=A0ACB9DLJ1_ARCLA|nr:hypothetical protein L6452_09797 [Arctium lappa]